MLLKQVHKVWISRRVQHVFMNKDM